MMHPPKIKDWMPFAVMTGKMKTGATLGLALADGDTDGLALALGLWLALGLTDGLALADGETLGL
jgi:hypothetical protein